MKKYLTLTFTFLLLGMSSKLKAQTAEEIRAHNENYLAAMELKNIHKYKELFYIKQSPLYLLQAQYFYHLDEP